MHDTTGYREPNAQLMLMLLFLVFVFTVPIRVILPAPGPEFRRGVVCLMELLFALPYIFGRARRENFVVLSPVAGALFVAWCIAAVVSVALSPHVLPALARQVEWICHAFFAACLWHFLRNNRRYVRYVLGFVVIGIVVSVLIVFLAWHADPSNANLHWRQYLPLFTHIRHFGYLALAGLLLAQVWAADDRAGSAGFLIALPVLCLLWGALIWTGGRAALAAALLGLTVTILLSAKRRWVLAGVNTVAISVGSVIAVYMSAGRAELGWQGILMRLGGNDLGSFATGRLKFWGLAYQNFLEHPVFGLGPDAYRYLTPKIFGSHPHNVVLQLLTDYGVVGGGIFAGLMAILGATMMLRAAEKRMDLRADRIVAVSVLLAFTANAMLDGTYYHAVPLMIIGTVLAVGLLPESYLPVSGGSRGLLAIRTGFATSAATTVAAFFVVYGVALTNFVAGPIPSPDGARAKMVRHMPLATHSLTLETWIRSWNGENPALAIEWAHWAHENSPDAYRFSSLEARLLMEEGLYDAAREHAELAIESATGRMRLAMSESLKPIFQAADANSAQLLFQVDDD